MLSPHRWPDAALAGLACSMRTSAGPALLALRGRVRGRARGALLAGAAVELAQDKAPFALDRIGAPSLGARVASGAYTGHDLAGAPGLAAGALSAAAGSFATWRARKLVVSATGLPDPAVAVGEDLIAIALAAAATREDRTPLLEPGEEEGEAPPRRSLARDALTGFAAGLAGTAAMTIAQAVEFVLTDAEPSSAPADVADTLKRRLGRGRLKRRHRRAANQAMHWLYGTSWGIPYGIVASTSRLKPEVSGPIFGLVVWVGALVQQPALGIAELPWKRSISSLGSEAAFHLVYGIGAGAAVRALRDP
jgi:hypothetical protein